MKKLNNYTSRRGSLLFLMLIFLSVSIQAQIVVTGRVSSESGEPLTSATVNNVQSKRSVVTGADGSFSIEARLNDQLQISIVGYLKKSIKVDGSGVLNVILESSDANLNEIVVVGYGTQKKVNVSGAVATVSGKVLTQRPSPNLQNLLQGRVAGLDIVQSTGEPGRDDAAIQIRGFGSYGSSNAPLILVDGVLASIKNLSPNDVESVTVLKDAASASIYGARAANGVILITTKTGRAGKSEIEYNGSYGTSEATRYPDLITNSVTYMEMYNSARARSGQPAIYTQQQIDLYKNNPNTDAYPSFDWMRYVLRKGPIQNHNLSFSGGSEKTVYKLSLSYLDQKAITKGYEYERYNALFNISSNVHKRVRIGSNINMSFQDAVAPWLTNSDLLLLAYASAPTIKPFLPDGRIVNRDFTTTSGSNRSVEEMYATGWQTTKTYIVNAQVFAEVDLLKGLKWMNKGAVTFQNEQYKNRQYNTVSYAYQPNTAGQYVAVGTGSPNWPNGMQQNETRAITKTFYSTLNYTTTFGKDHNVSLLAGYEQQNNYTSNIFGARYEFPLTTINVLDGSGLTNQATGGGAFEWALQSIFGRVSYDYKGKYFLEGNFRRDGSSRLAPSGRWGTFGGGSAAWKISSEDFILNNAPWIDNLKLRASYGSLGNQEIGNYPYQDILDLVAYPLGNSLNSGVRLNRLVTKDLRWEKTSSLDFGVDIDIFKGLFGATIDWYKRVTSDIISPRADLPASVGLSAPIVNAGTMENTGIEVELRHNNTIGQFRYGVGFLFHKYNNKVTKLLAETLGTIEIGRPYNNFFVWEWAGIFQSQDEINKSAKQPNSGTLRPGDLKIADKDGNGTVGPEDRIRIARFPSYNYSFNFNVGWKGFNLTAFFQGVEGIKVQVNGWGIDPFQQGAAPPKDFLNAWSPTNPSTTVPAVYVVGYAGVSGYNSTYYIRDASYLRLKNLYLSYTFPEELLKKISSKGLTLYFSGDNVITWTQYKGNDPERAGSGRYAQFPQLRVLTGGLNIKF